MGRSRLFGLLLAIVVVACSGSGGTTSTVDAPATTAVGLSMTTIPTTTIAPTTTTSVSSTTSSAAVSVDDVPAECREAIAQLLGVYEPVVSGVDWENATIDDHLSVAMALAGQSIDVDTSSCNVELDVTDEEGARLFREIAGQEAPGTLAYFDAILAIEEALGDRTSTGECRPDIDTFEKLVAGGVPFVDLPLPEQYLALQLIGSIGFCSLQTQGDLMSRPEVQEFLAGSPFG